MARKADAFSAPAAGAYALSAGLFSIGVVCAVRPPVGSRIFGLPAAPSAMPYVRALAFRDFATAGALSLLAAGPPGPLRALALSLALIPLGDLNIVARHSGRRAWPSLLLHAISAVALLSVAAGAGRRRPDGRHIPPG